ncbi:hypothetical protein GCM10017783_16450 [Deinococcus piscis]|uniref:Uncharacterized protein n=1 Tax=Deinococcus piscis TaxID=394230 RepID=A0ABQ3K6U3_9DEIO|nr:hypothetical protein [Deinococcus piscis]GHG04530.1 hypothetical protein GCM10017783_16450 [Deinococcus piscis]
MTQNDDSISVVPEISPAGNELPHQSQAGDPAMPQAEQGPAPVVMQDSAWSTPDGEALSSAEVAAMTGGEASAEANQALDRAEGHEDPSQS